MMEKIDLSQMISFSCFQKDLLARAPLKPETDQTEKQLGADHG